MFCTGENHSDTPIALFDEEPDPNKKPMYPKHLVSVLCNFYVSFWSKKHLLYSLPALQVYKDGKDIQLEEIYAVRYWEKQKGNFFFYRTGLFYIFAVVFLTRLVYVLAAKVMNITKTIVPASVDNEVKTEVNRLPLSELKVSENDIKPQVSLKGRVSGLCSCVNVSRRIILF